MQPANIRFCISVRAALHGTAAIFALAVPAVAAAQDDQPAEEYYGNDIVVTATKREQTLQDVPVAVSVTTAESIERAQIRDLKDLSSLVPSLRVRTNQASGQTNFFIRGFGNGANNPGIEPSVGVFVDNVYRSRAVAQITDLPDIERVEVLRGPQTTLFGKNASAGIISIVTQRPKFDFGGNVEASYGNYDAIVLKGVITGPLSESIAASLAAGYNRRDGYARDLVSGADLAERDRWFVRSQLLLEPNNDLSVRLIGDYGKIDETCCIVVSLLNGPATNAIRALGGQVNLPADRFAGEVYYNFPPENRIKNYGFSGQVDYQLGDFKLTSITAWRKTDSFSNYDADFTSADLVQRNAYDVGIETFTQELRFTGNPMDRLTMLLGAYYFDEKISQDGVQPTFGPQARPYFDLLVRGATGGALSIPLLEQTFGALEGNPAKYAGRFFAAGTGFSERYRLKNEAISIFGQLDWEIADRLTLTGGLNYTSDKKRFSTDITANEPFAAINFNAPAYAPFRNQLLFQSGLAQTIGTQLGLGRNATAAEIGAFAAANPAAFGQISAATQAFATANQNNPLMNPLNAFRGLQITPPFLNVPNVVEPGKTDDDNVSWTVRLSYDATDSINVYAGIAKGFKASSVNLSTGSRPSPADQAAITSAGIAVVNQSYGSRFAAPEKATVYEAGLKADWGVVGGNLAVFKQEIKGFQSNIFTGIAFFLGNAGKQSVFGIEFEGFAKPIPELTLGLSMTYLDPKYDSFPNSAFGDATGVTPADIPPIAATFSADYVHELANADRIIAHADFHYEAQTQQIEGLPAFIVRNPLSGAVVSYQPGLDAARPFTREVDELNASLTYAMENGLELTVWGRNLLDDRYITQIFDSPAQIGSVSGYVNQPRTYGAAVRFRW
jgi:outer membrane receptor protein involved in Fe transport